MDTKPLMLRGEIRRAYNMNTQPDYIFEYLSDMRVLLGHVPNAQRIQLRKNSGRARIFFNMSVLSVNLDIVIDVEPQIDSENRTIRLDTPAAPLGVIPPGYLTGRFDADIKIAPNDKGGSRIVSMIGLEFDANQIDLLQLFSPSFLKTTGLAMLQEYVANMSSDYLVRLSRDFPVWEQERKRA